MNSDLDVMNEIARLRKATVSDVAERPERYSCLVAMMSSIACRPFPRDFASRHDFTRDVFELVLQSLPTEQHFAEAIRELFGIEGYQTVGLNARRRLASAAWDGMYRGADTFYRDIEKVLDHQLFLTLKQLADERPVHRVGNDLHYEEGLENWEYDLERAGSSIAQQAFADADRLLTPRLSIAFRREHLNGPAATTLLARSFELAGDAQRDRGNLDGPNGARHRYREAQELNLQLGRLPRANSNELMIAVCQEMAGHLVVAHRSYQRLTLSIDEPVLDFDRERARLWTGTVLAKQGDGESALPPIYRSISYFVDAGDHRMLGNAYQKLALAHLKTRHPHLASGAMEFAEEFSDTNTPLTHVRFMIAKAHVLWMCGERSVSETLFENARMLARTNNLEHQLSSIEALCRTLELEESK
ncbi:hypothetical protein [Acidithrix sp. C25]|uniref:hypothetical protein n=1 Tax=Acidithrix sp. C25 TaxID=1671482 RepID=UPI001BD03BD6|nr:hypothetical protein [Acidithrix sp. C25]